MADDRPNADGTVEQGPDGSTRIRFVRRLPHPVDRVWEALADPAELRRWWGDTDLDLVEGGRFALRWRNTDATDPGTPTTLTEEVRHHSCGAVLWTGRAAVHLRRLS